MDKPPVTQRTPTDEELRCDNPIRYVPKPVVPTVKPLDIELVNSDLSRYEIDQMLIKYQQSQELTKQKDTK